MNVQMLPYEHTASLRQAALRRGIRDSLILVICLLFLILFSVPAVRNVSLNINLAVMPLDVSAYQLLILAGSLTLVALSPKRRVGFFTRRLFAVFVVLGLYNFSTTYLHPPEVVIPLLRGIFNFAINLAAAFLITQVLKLVSVRAFSAMLVSFGILVALSALVEYLLLQLAPQLVILWRSWIWGPLPLERVLAAGGARLDLEGLTRVGGLIGAPENLGFVLALTLPCLALARVSPRAQAGILVLYGLAAAVTATRTLWVALLLYSALWAIQPRRLGRRSLLLLAAGTFTSLLILSLSVNLEGLARFSGEKLLYEWKWRSGRLLALLQVLDSRDAAWLTGLGLGWGAELLYGLKSLTKGILGGDFIAGYGLGGIIGLGIIGLIWQGLLKIWWRLRRVPLPSVQRAFRFFLLFLLLLALLRPVFMDLIFHSNVLTLLLIVIPILAETCYHDWRRSSGMQEAR